LANSLEVVSRLSGSAAPLRLIHRYRYQYFSMAPGMAVAYVGMQGGHPNDGRHHQPGQKLPRFDFG
jgi:hypothetical protein